MSLPWFRMDSSIATHDKILDLTSDPSTARWQAFASYVCALGWSNLHETDGRVPLNALPFVHGTTKTARLLVKYGLWEEAPGAFRIVNFSDRQPLAQASEAVRDSRAAGGRKGNCVRHHGPDCWRDGRCTKAEAP